MIRAYCLSMALGMSLLTLLPPHSSAILDFIGVGLASVFLFVGLVQKAPE